MITIVILYDDNSCDHWVGAVGGQLTAEQKAKMAEQFDAVIDGEPGSHEEEGRTIVFHESEPQTIDQLVLHNIWPPDYSDSLYRDLLEHGDEEE